MCGRYRIETNHKDMYDLYKILTDEEEPCFVGDVYPSNLAPIFTANKLLPTFCKWGLESFDKTKLLINVRAETVTQKPMFSENFAQQRCVIPCNGFYEWDSDKNKYYFTRVDGNLIYLCGFYRERDGASNFAILTKNATPPVSRFHHRIPVMLDEKQTAQYLRDTEFAQKFMSKENTIELNYN
ncbi:MAG: SOS response-associated peptidase family protein [Clostridiales bacterium]|nr:SOS response-associated peptidase family protein [Clostridiales bacterium]